MLVWVVDSKMSARRRRRCIIIDEASDDESIEASDHSVAPNASRRAFVCDMEGLSDSSSSFDKCLESLRIQSFDDQENDNTGFLADAETSLHCAKADTAEDESSDCTHPWLFDKASDEFCFDDSPTTHPIQWPAFRLPGRLYRKLYGFQKDGVRWMGGLHHNRIGGLLGDDMGMVSL